VNNINKGSTETPKMDISLTSQALAKKKKAKDRCDLGTWIGSLGFLLLMSPILQMCAEVVNCDLISYNTRVHSVHESSDHP
jgi:hypothetical protein